MVDAGTVVATHLNHLVHIHAAGVRRTAEVATARPPGERVAQTGGRPDSQALAAFDPAKFCRTSSTRTCISATCAPIVEALMLPVCRMRMNRTRWCIALGRAIVQQIWPQAGVASHGAGLGAGKIADGTHCRRIPTGLASSPAAETLLREAAVPVSDRSRWDWCRYCSCRAVADIASPVSAPRCAQ